MQSKQKPQIIPSQILTMKNILARKSSILTVDLECKQSFLESLWESDLLLSCKLQNNDALICTTNGTPTIC